MVVLGRALCIELYDDSKKGQNNDTLEAALFAAANTE